MHVTESFNQLPHCIWCAQTCHVNRFVNPFSFNIESKLQSPTLSSSVNRSFDASSIADFVASSYYYSFYSFENCVSVVRLCHLPTHFFSFWTTNPISTHLFSNNHLWSRVRSKLKMPTGWQWTPTDTYRSNGINLRI